MSIVKRFGSNRSTGTHSLVRRSPAMLIFMMLLASYSLVPLLWLLINAAKTQADVMSTFGLWFGHGFNLINNVKETFAYKDGIFATWLLNTFLYVLIGAGGAAFWRPWRDMRWLSLTFRARKASSPR